MSLVAYADSDESGIESEDEDTVTSTEKKVAPIISKKSTQDGTDKTPAVNSGVNDDKKPKSMNLKSTASKPVPLPSSHTTSINFDMKILDKKRSQPIRITIPSLKDFEEEEPKKPKLRPSTKGSSLFSMLPAPKNVASSASLMPQAVSKAQKPKPTPPAKRLVKPAAVARKQNADEEEDASSEPLTSFFFSGADDEPLPPPVDIETPAMIGDTAPSSSVGSFTQQDQVSTSTYEMMSSDQFANVGTIQPPTAENFNQRFATEEDEAPLDVDALRKLCGTRDRKKGPDLSDIIDVSGSALVGDSSMILAKELSKEQPTHSFKRKSECSSLQRRKHQITYLAEQAKAQELELRNNWAQNRVTRKQTQAKYGF